MLNFNQYINLKYKHKGRGPEFFDCYGFVRYIYEQDLGVTLPDFIEVGYSKFWSFEGKVQHISSKIDYKDWKVIPNIGGAEPYDLVTIYRNLDSKIVNHIGLVIGRGKFIHIISRRTSETAFLELWENRIHKILRYGEIQCL